MDGPGGRPTLPIDPNIELSWRRQTVCLRHGGKFSFKYLTFGHFLYENSQKAFSFRSLTPTRGSRSALSPWSAPPSLANPGSATVMCRRLGAYFSDPTRTSSNRSFWCLSQKGRLQYIGNMKNFHIPYVLCFVVNIKTIDLKRYRLGQKCKPSILYTYRPPGYCSGLRCQCAISLQNASHYIEHKRRRSVKFRGQDIYARKICMKH